MPRLALAALAAFLAFAAPVRAGPLVVAALPAALATAVGTATVSTLATTVVAAIVTTGAGGSVSLFLPQITHRSAK